MALLNTADLSPVLESRELMWVAEIIKTSSATQTKPEEKIEVALTVANLSSTAPITSMIQSGQVQATVNGMLVQNGLATTQMNTKVRVRVYWVLLICL